MSLYFVYSADYGFETFVAADDAEAVAEDIINQYREDACEDGWDEDVESVCWGIISQQAKIIHCEPNSEQVTGSCPCDYVLSNKQK